jgi:hypothetical protein
MPMIELRGSWLNSTSPLSDGYASIISQIAEDFYALGSGVIGFLASTLGLLTKQRHLARLLTAEQVSDVRPCAAIARDGSSLCPANSAAEQSK